VEIRAFQAADIADCLALFDSDAGESFSPAERGAFAQFLTSLPGPYFVAEHEGQIVGCGGFARDDRGMRLTWGMVRPDFRGHGIGKLLLMYRLREIGKLGAFQVGLDTSQKTAGFFEKFGFRPVSVEADGYGPGLDKIGMVKKMEVCA
jgi:GNAT superfamily N-acetyltransferase